MICSFNNAFKLINSDVDVLAGKSYVSTVRCFATLGMSDEPLVTSPKELILVISFLKSGLVGVGSLGKNYGYAESVVSVALAGSIVKAVFVYENNIACFSLECYNVLGIELSVVDILCLCKEKNERSGSDVELASSVILKAVELGVSSPAHTYLNRHSAVSAVCEILVKIGASFEAVDSGLVSYSLCGKIYLIHCIKQCRYIISS